jgi:hypothetical protein
MVWQEAWAMLLHVVAAPWWRATSARLRRKAVVLRAALRRVWLDRAGLRKFLGDNPSIIPQLDDHEAEITYLLLRERRPEVTVELARAAISATMITATSWWLRRFDRGPMEYAWHWAWSAPQHRRPTPVPG